jgi:hypothetical protein
MDRVIDKVLDALHLTKNKVLLIAVVALVLFLKRQGELAIPQALTRR